MLTRFAPSPTGYLHVGNISIALANWLFTQKNSGQFLLRIDDTDTDRSTIEYLEGIYTDMAWLGLAYDQTFKQSDRVDRYEMAAERLKEMGRLYPCYETPEELELKRRRQQAMGRPPIYDRGALKLSADDIAKFEAEGRKPHWRFKIMPGTVSWDDMVHKTLQFEGDHLSDPVLIREDGRPIYTLSSVVDDIESGITHIIRGDDHIANTAVQIQLIETLTGEKNKITFGHMPLTRAPDGGPLSKRLGGISIREIREQGYEPMALLSLLAKIGTSEAIDIEMSMEKLIQHYDISKVTLSSAKFAAHELERLNQKYIAALAYEQVRDRLNETCGADVPESFWEVAKGNIKKFGEIQAWWQICCGHVTPIIEEKEYIQEALKALPNEPWNDETWVEWTTSLKESTGRKGKELFMPLRLALTGLPHGPEMRYVLPQIGYKRVIERLSHD
jgi:glutamyl-tRNA synthetase